MELEQLRAGFELRSPMSFSATITVTLSAPSRRIQVGHHHLVMPPARISLTLSPHSTLSFIASGRSSGLHPISSQSCCMKVRAGHPAFSRSCDGVHRRASLLSSSLLLQQCHACLVRLTSIVFVMGGRWPYSWCIVVCCLQDSQHACIVAVKLFLHPFS